MIDIALANAISLEHADAKDNGYPLPPGTDLPVTLYVIEYHLRIPI